MTPLRYSYSVIPISHSKRYQLHARSAIFASLLAMALLALSGCGSSLTIPKPKSSAPRPLPPLEVSVVQIPVVVDLRPIFAQVEKQVPSAHRASKDWTVVGKNAVGDIGVKYEIWRDPLQLTVEGDRARIYGNVRYWFQFAQRVPKPIIGGSFWQALGSCGVGEAPRQAQIAIDIRMNWTESWSLAPTITIAKPGFSNKCEVTFLKYDVTDRVSEAFMEGLKQGRTHIEAKIKEAGNFKAIAESVWKQLHEPIELDSALWLTFNPVNVAASAPAGSKTTVSTTIGFAAQPAVVAGAKPKSAPRPLPKLVTANSGGGLHVHLEGELTFDEASRRLAKALAGKNFTRLGHTITVTDASVYGAGDRAVIQLALKGDVNGTIYLVGQPAYDPENDRVYLRDLDYSLETGETLAKVADWLFHGTFRSSIAQGAQWELTKEIASARKRLEKALNRTIAPNVTSRGAITSIRPVGVFMTENAFRARASIEGTLRLDVAGGR